MNRFASLLSAAVLAASTLAAHATPVVPDFHDYSITIGSTVLNTTNLSIANPLTFSDGLSLYTIVGANLDPLVDALSITRVCVNLNPFSPGCAAQAVSISNASVLGGLLQLNAGLGVNVSAGAQAGVTNLLFASTTVGVAAETALVGYPAPTAPTSSPVPEPGTLSLMATGLIGAAGALRRKFVA